MYKKATLLECKGTSTLKNFIADIKMSETSRVLIRIFDFHQKFFKLSWNQALSIQACLFSGRIFTNRPYLYKKIRRESVKIQSRLMLLNVDSSFWKTNRSMPLEVKLPYAVIVKNFINGIIRCHESFNRSLVGIKRVKGIYLRCMCSS